MGDIILWRPRSKSATMKPLRSDNLAYPSPADEAEAKALTEAHGMTLPCDVEPREDDGA